MLPPDPAAAPPEAGSVAPLTLRLFGPFEARLHGQPLPRLHSRKVQWLLALLVLRHGREVERAWLAGTLWPDSSEAAANACLRNSLKDLRRAFGPEAGRLRSPTTRTLALDLTAAHADVVAFDQAMAEGEETALERAVALYRGPLLEGCAEEWAFQERQLREHAVLTALETLAARAMERGDLAAAERHLQRTVALEPLRETAQRALMQALATGGNYGAAMEVYRELRLRLHRELNAAPDAETQALCQQLRTEARGKAAHSSRLTAQGESARVREPCTLSREPPLPEGTLTFLFTDIEGSSQLWEQHPEAMKSALEQHDVLLRQAIQAHGGLVFKTVGDAFYAAFATAPAAVTAALAVQQALLTEEWGDTGPLRVRMALHTGIAEAREGDYFGPTLNRVARLLEAGHGGQVLLSLPTEELVRDELPEGASMRPLGEHRLKDLVRPERVFQLLHPALPTEFPRLRSLEAFTHNLPVQWTSFVGREQEMETVKQLLPTTHLLTLTGPGGCGKTRLALQVATDLIEIYRDGVWLVELAALTDPNLLPQAVATALGVPEGPGRALIATLIEYLRARSLLLVLDNCEHLIQSCAQFVEPLLRACPDLQILATSRERLGLTGERVYPVPSLSLPTLVNGSWLVVDGLATAAPSSPSTINPPASRVPEPSTLMKFEAVHLFVERAVYIQPQFTLSAQNAGAVAQLCQQLDGIPLALELAAARVKALSVEQLAARLDDAFRLLTGGSRTALPRQQTLRALIDWSYDLLSEAEQALLRRLSVFAGGWTLETAEAVCSDNGIEEWEVLDLLTSLVEKSLVLYEEREGEPRYRLLETVRQYARDRLEERGETAGVRGRHRDWFLALAERAEPELRRSDQLVWLDRLDGEHDNLRAALEWCRAEAEGAGASQSGWMELRVASALLWFWVQRSYQSEGRQYLEAALSRASDAPARLRIRALQGAGRLTLLTHSDYAAAVRLFQASLDLARATNDPEGMTIALSSLALQSVMARDSERAAALAEAGLVGARTAGDPWLLAFCLQIFGLAVRLGGDLDRATALFHESLAMARQVGDRWIAGLALTNVGGAAQARGDYETAWSAYQEALVRSRELRDQRGMAMALECLAEAAVGLDRPLQGARLMGAGQGLLDTIGASWPPNYVASRERTQAAVCAALGEAAFTAAHEEGRAMPLEQAIAAALDEGASG
jgi:predicted ATPase/class 3 adenylate cyclase